MLPDLDQTVDAHFIYREMTAERLIEILDFIRIDRPDARVCPNRVGNLAVLNKNDREVGYIDFAEEEFMPFDD